jgi:putative hydrolase of the HAD superfamily
MLRAIFFDMGGTLDGDGHWLDRFVRLYADHGLAMSRAIIRRGFDYAEQCAAADDDIVRADMETLVRRHLTWQFSMHGLVNDLDRESLVQAFLAPIRGAALRNASILAELRRRGFVLGVISNACGNAQALCDDLGYSEYLSGVIDSRVVGVAKPDPRIYTLALDRLGVDAADAMMVGDSYERDIVPANQLGMQTRWLVQGAMPPSQGVADACIASIEQLPLHVTAAERATA